MFIHVCKRQKHDASHIIHSREKFEFMCEGQINHNNNLLMEKLLTN